MCRLGRVPPTGMCRLGVVSPTGICVAQRRLPETSRPDGTEVRCERVRVERLKQPVPSRWGADTGEGKGRLTEALP
eukprot:scaffold13482_cov79-Isochrysis_galbana.AAC.1